MSNFDHLKTLDVAKTSTAEYLMGNITVNGMSPTLIVSPATDANKPFFNALLKRSSKTVGMIKSGVMSTDIIDGNRNENRDLYPTHVLKGWKDMINAETGKEIPFSRNEAKEFFNALPNWLFDDLVVFCMASSNFADVMDIQVQAKN